MAVQGHAVVDREVEFAVALSLLRSPLDTRACRLFKEHRASCPADPAGRLSWLADGLELPSAERGARIAEALAEAPRALARAARAALTPVPWWDPEYPPLLAEIVDPPIVLWLSGSRSCLGAPIVAVVGARQATPAGLAVARRLGGELAEAGLVVASGLARGVDGAAHAGCLDAGGTTIGVLGCGADITYPAEHRELVARMRASGAIISEFAPGTPPLPPHFPLRNRIISGLSRAVVVIEAHEKSGSLITAKAGLEQGRDVLAVPGSVASGRYRGSHALIKDGARLVETVNDILDEIKWTRPLQRLQDGGRNTLVVSELEATMAVSEPYSVDDLVAATGRPAPEILAELGALELAGKVSRSPGGLFVRLDESAIGGGRSYRA